MSRAMARLHVLEEARHVNFAGVLIVIRPGSSVFQWASLMLVASYSDLASHALGEDPFDLAEIQDLLATTTQAALDGGETVKRLLLFTRAVPEQDSQLVDLS